MKRRRRGLKSTPLSPEQFARSVNRRIFLSNSACGIGRLALASLLDRAGANAPDGRWRGVIAPPHFPVKAKRIIHLSMAGGPSQFESFDFKRDLRNVDKQPISARQWSAGILPSKFQGITFQSKGDAVHYIGNPDDVCQSVQRQVVEEVNRLNGMLAEERVDPEIQTRIAQYELAFKMQSSVPDLTDFSKEPKEMLEKYGVEKPGDGSLASHCLLARRANDNRRPLANLNGEIVYTNMSNSHFLSSPNETVVVPSGHYFLLGDNSAHSFDSRFLGFVPAKSITGRVIFRK